MSSTLALEESKFAKFRNNAEEAIFGVIYNIQKTRDFDLPRVNYLAGLAAILLDFVQIMPFLVHGYGYGSFTLTWGRFLRYVQLQLQLTSFQAFAPAFWASVVITLIIFGNASYAASVFYKKETPHPLSLFVSKWSFNLVLPVLFIAGFKLLMTPWWCNPLTQNLYPFEDHGEAVSCWGMPNIIYLIVGSIFVLILSGIMLVSRITFSNYAPVPNDLFSTSTPIYRIAFYLAMMFMTIDENLIARAIPVVGRWWEALFNLFISSALLAIVVYFLPFQIRLGNEIRAGFLGVVWWTSAVSFVVVNMPGNPYLQTRLIEYVLIAGMIPFAAIGVLLVRERYLVFQSLATALVSEIEENFESNELYRAKYATKKEDQVEGANRNPLLNLNPVIRQFNPDTYGIEVIGRLLWHSTGKKENVEAAYRFYREAEAAFPDLASVKLMRATCLTYLSPDPTAFVEQLDGVKKLDPPFVTRFLLFKRNIESKLQMSRSSEGEDGLDKSMDVLAYSEFQKYYAEAQKFNIRAIKAIREFWNLFLQPSITTSAFNHASADIEIATQKALATYKTLIIRYPKQIYILSSYAYFLELVLHNAEEAQRYHQRADQLRARETDDSGLTDGGTDSQAMVTIAEDGTIEQINKSVTIMFGWQRGELIGRNVKLLVPSPYREKHDNFLERYKATGNAKVIGQPPRPLFGLYKTGYAFGITLSLQEKRKENGDRCFVAMIVQTDKDSLDGTIVIDEVGTVIMISKNVETLFGYKAFEVLRTNVTIFMIDAFAANHDGYLKRYNETGEARVIGTAGRNVPARRKDGTTFPVSLNVAEDYIAGERYYVAKIIDTSNVIATIYINGFGAIQNCDQGITTLLGYFKEDLIGKNIKNIMPPPYNQYHDMYLERYRRTKVSNILRSTDGRVLPAIHADGSVVQIRAIIQRSDTGDGGSSANMLFKGIIKRIDGDTSANNQVRRGFNDKCTIEMKKDGTIISVDPSILNLLGFGNDKDSNEYVGQSIETIVPPLPDYPRQQKSKWISQALSNQDMNFYILLLSKNSTLLPFTYSLSMKSADIILMRVRDLLSTDALLTIDEVGTIISINDDAFLLLGHEPDEVINRNIKILMAEEIAVQHDGFLARYKETQVARVVGVARTLSTIHRDQSSMPIEIQVTEVKAGDGNTFVGRLRHLAIDYRVDREFIAGLFVNLKQEQNNDLKEDLSKSQLSIRVTDDNGKFVGSQTINVEAVQQENAGAAQSEEEEEEESDSTISDSDDEDEEDDTINEGLEDKLKNIKNTDKLDPNNVRLQTTLRLTLGVFVALSIAALVTFNVWQKPYDLFTFGDRLNKQAIILNEVIYEARVLYLKQNADVIITALKSDAQTANYWPCTWGTNTTILPACPFAWKTDSQKNLEKFTKDLLEDQEWFNNFYPKIRVANDVLDSVYSDPVTYWEYINGAANPPIQKTVPTWADFVGSKINDAADKLSNDINLGNPESRLDWQFIVYNRDVITNRLVDLQKAVYTKALNLLAAEVLTHLIFTLVYLFISGLAFFVVLLPVIRRVQADRLVVLKLLLLVPRSIVMDFVTNIYKDPEDVDEENDFDDGKSVGSTKKAEILKRQRKLDSDETVDIVVDNGWGLFLFFGIGLFTISIPTIAHVAWRYSFNTGWEKELHKYEDVVSVYTRINALSWRALGIWAPISVVPAADRPFWYNLTYTGSRLKAAADVVQDGYELLQEDFAGIAEFNYILYNIKQQKSLFKGCSESDLTTVKYRPGTNYTYKETKDYTVPSYTFRCNLKYKTTATTPPELALPADYATLTTKGVGQYVKNTLESAWLLGDVNGYKSNTPIGPVDKESYFYLSEALYAEGNEGLYEVKRMVGSGLLTKYSATETAYNATYAVTLVYTFILFIWVFGKVERDLANETRNNRSSLFMVPMAIISKSKPISEYIERVFHELNDY